MKKTMALICILIFAHSAVWAQTSQKGKWSRFDKDKFYLDMSKEDLSVFGDKKDAWLDCYFLKLQDNFESYSDANTDEGGCSLLALACNDEVLGCVSEKGHWSKADKEAFYSALEAIDLSDLGKKKKKWMDCYFEKVQDAYVSFNSANADFIGCTKLAKECSNDVLNR